MDMPSGAILAVESKHSIAACQVALDCAVVDDRDVELAVIVAVEQRNAARRHRLDHVSPLRRRMWSGCQSRLAADLTEGHNSHCSGVGMTCFHGPSDT